MERIIGEERTSKTDKQQAIEALIGSVSFPPEYDDPDYDPDYELLRESAYRDRGLETVIPTNSGDCAIHFKST